MASLRTYHGAAAAATTVLLYCLYNFVIAASAQSTSTMLDSSLSTHVLNMTLSGATGEWPSTDEALASLTATVTTTVCGRLPSTVEGCEAFLMAVSANVLGLQVSVQTLQSGEAYMTYTTLQAWSVNAGDPPLTALATACAAALGVPLLDPLNFRSGVYLMPCRNQAVYEFLPVCQPGEVERSVIYIGNATGSTDLATYFRGKICTAGVDCSSVTLTVTPPSLTNAYTTVNITNAATALEAILAYVADVRAAYNFLIGNLLAPNEGGNRDAGVSATSVEMHHTGTVATLFSEAENQRYTEAFRATVQCSAQDGFWAFALIAVVAFFIMFFRYMWCRGRHRSKKHQRRLIIEDERRIMQGYASPMAGNISQAPEPGAANAAAPSYYNGDGTAYDGADVPPGVDYQRMLSQAASNTPGGGGTVWMMDADGNYYEVPAEQYAASTRNQGSGDGTRDDAGATYQETAVDAHANGDGANVAGGGYMTYVDPNTGETYQYEVPAGDNAVDEPAQAGEEGEDVVAADAQEGGEGAGEMQTYMDPETGETYQYDPSAVDYREVQTYVDPESGETYQYDASAAQGETELQTYVDPETGETYQYDPNAVDHGAEAEEG